MDPRPLVRYSGQLDEKWRINRRVASVYLTGKSTRVNKLLSFSYSRLLQLTFNSACLHVFRKVRVMLSLFMKPFEYKL